MKYPASRVSQRRFGALALAILLLLAHVHPTLAKSKPKNYDPAVNELWNAQAVPNAISASDWAGIRAAHQAAQSGSSLTNKRARQTSEARRG